MLASGVMAMLLTPTRKTTAWRKMLPMPNPGWLRVRGGKGEDDLMLANSCWLCSTPVCFACTLHALSGERDSNFVSTVLAPRLAAFSFSLH